MKPSMNVLALGLVATALLVGCGGGEPAAQPAATTTGAAAVTTTATTGGTAAVVGGRGAGVSAASLGIGSLPGLPTEEVPDTQTIFKLESRTVASRYGGARPDPFSLKSKEKAYDIEQNSARLLGEMGGMTIMYTPPPEKQPDAGLIQDPQPYRRLSGIIVGDSVYALMDTGGQIEILRPGMRVPNTEWEVVSIDQEKAILRRTGNKLPRQITVRLESPPPGMGGASNPGGGPGGFGSGMPGGPPGGRTGGSNGGQPSSTGAGGGAAPAGG